MCILEFGPSFSGSGSGSKKTQKTGEQPDLENLFIYQEENTVGKKREFLVI